MKRLLQICLGMVLLGIAGLILMHQVVDTPTSIRAQAGAGATGAPPGANGFGQPSGVPGQYKDIVPALLGALADTEGSVRQLAAATLAKIGPDATVPLVEALKSKDREARANAAYVLGHLGESAPETLGALATALKDEDKEVRRRAAYALYSIVSRSESGGLSADGGMPMGSGGPAIGMSMRGMSGASTPMPGMYGLPDPGLLLPVEKK